MANSVETRLRAERVQKWRNRREREAFLWVLGDKKKRGHIALQTIIEAAGFYDDIPARDKETDALIGSRRVAIMIRRMVEEHVGPAALRDMEAELEFNPDPPGDDEPHDEAERQGEGDEEDELPDWP